MREMWVSNGAGHWAALLPFGPPGSASALFSFSWALFTAAKIRRKSAGANGLVSVKGSKLVEQSQIYGFFCLQIAVLTVNERHLQTIRPFKWYRTETIPLFSHWSLTRQLKAMMTALWLHHLFDVMGWKVHQLQVTYVWDIFLLGLCR